MRNMLRIWLSLILAIAIMAPALPAAVLAEQSDSREVYELLQIFHLNGLPEELENLDDIAVMLEALGDPHTEYMTPQEWKAYQSVLNSNYEGVGMYVGKEEDGYRVSDVIPGTPAERAGILKGDLIIGVDDFRYEEAESLDDLVNRILGPAGTTVTIRMKRMSEELEFQVTRESITLPSVRGELFDGDIAYLRVYSFSSKAAFEFDVELERLRALGARALIIDLRDNPGGRLDVVAVIAEHFIEEGVLIHTRDRYMVEESVVISNGRSESMPTTVLVNGQSASAAEILAGALQDYGLAELIGTNTYGKGSVQMLFTLSTGAMLKMTMEEYLTPNLHKVDGVGIQPDIVVEGDLAQLLEALRRSGAKQLQVRSDSRSLAVNGVEFSARLIYLQDEEKVYLPSRLLASLAGADLRWDDDEQTVYISLNGVEFSYPADSGHVILEQGTSFIEAGYFQRNFPLFYWSAEGDEVTAGWRARR